ncbi:hypothetical protein [Tropicimonas sp. S265A]
MILLNAADLTASLRVSSRTVVRYLVDTSSLTFDEVNADQAIASIYSA